MGPKQVAARITGFSTPVFGISWNPTETDVNVAQRVITFLEDRRVLFNPFDLETREHCVESVGMIREKLTEELGKLPNSSGLPQHLRMIRQACRAFLDKLHPNGKRGIIQPHMFRHGDDAPFFMALGELRSAIGVHIAVIAAMHGLGIEGDLASVLPPPPEKN